MLSELNLTGRYTSEGVVPGVGPGREVPGASRRPSSELGRAWLGPPGSAGLVRLEEEEAGLLGLSEASGGSELRLETSERSPLVWPARPWTVVREEALTGKGGGQSSFWLCGVAGPRLLMVS